MMAFENNLVSVFIYLSIMKKYFYLAIILILSNSCANIFNGVVLPNSCKRCEVINSYTQQVVWDTEGCGSENTRLEEKAKEKAYDLSRQGGDLCDLEVRCEEWTREEQ